MSKTKKVTRKYDEKIVKHAYAIWEVMHSEAKKRGMALQREGELGNGRVIITTVGAFIKGLDKERDWGLNDSQRDLIRRYLKASGNVVVLSKMEDYRFRIFIREEWTNASLITKPVKDGSNGTSHDPYGNRLNPEEAGETKPAAPVTYKCAACQESFSSKQALGGHVSQAHKNERATVKQSERIDLLGEVGNKVMRLLEEQGGKIVDPSGLVKTRLIELDPSLDGRATSEALKGLEDRGWITRDINSRRTYKIALTRERRRSMKNLDYYRQAIYPIQEYIAQHGRIIADDVPQVLCDRFGFARYRTSGALKALEESGAITVERNASGIPVKVTNYKEPITVDKVEKKPAEVEFVDDLPPIKRPRKKQEEPVLKHADISDADLVAELSARLKADAASVEEIEQYKQRLELIESLVNESIEGKMSPLKALAEIQEAVTL